MRGILFPHYLFLVLVIPLISCAHTEKQLRVRSPIPLTAYGVSGSTVGESYPIPANEVVALKNPVSRLETPGYQPLLIALASDESVQRSKDSPVEVKLKPVEDWKSDATEAYVTKQLDSLYLEFLRVLDLARTNRVKEALAKTDEIIKDYPKLASAYYVRAQVEILDGKRAKAMESLQSALSLKPEFKEAITLRDQIQKGGSP